MQATADSLAFAPPPEPAAVRGFLLAAVAHILLIVALTWGINWDKDTTPAAVEAELWSAMPQEAAPPPPPPPPPVQQQVVQAPPVVTPPPPVVEKAPDINIERDKKRKQEEAKREREREEEKRRLEAQKKKQEEQRWLAQEKKQREELAKKEKQKQEQLDAKKHEQLRKEQIARMQAMASGGGSPSSQGAAAKASGPSDSYAGRIRARVKPNIVFTDDVPGNPSTEVEVRMAPDGTIVARKINKASGVKSWDEAVLRA